MYKLIFIALFPIQIFCAEIDYDKYEKLINEKLGEIERSQMLLADSFDVYIYYWLNGVHVGLVEGKKTVNECILTN